MASISGEYVPGAAKRIQWTIEGLENPVAQYDGFRVSTSDGKSKSWSDGTAFDYTTDHACGTNVTGYGYATWDGVEYSVGSDTVYTVNCPDTTAPTLQLTWTRYTNHIEVNHACINQDGDFSQVQLRVNGALQYSVFVTQYTYDMIGLSPNTTYTFEWIVWDHTNNSRTYTHSISTTAGFPPNSPTDFSFYAVDAANRIYNVSWTASAGATSYEVDALNNGSRAIKYQGSSTSTNITLDATGTTYQIEVYAFNANGTSSALIGYITTEGTTPPPPNSGTPVTPPPVGGGAQANPGPLEGGISFIRQSPNSPFLDYYIMHNGNGASNYRIVARRDGDSQWYQKWNGGYPSGTFRFDYPNTLYYVRVYACHDGANDQSCGPPLEGSFTTDAFPDTRGPTVMQTYDSHGRSIDVAWSISDITNDSATDTESGFEHAVLFMSGPNQTSPRNQMFVTYAAQSSSNLTVDGNGAAIAPQSLYYFHWEAYDVKGNKTTTSAVEVETTLPRPVNFDWDPVIVSGASFNMTAIQWQSFTIRINQFRDYIGLPQYSFSVPVVGFQFAAGHYNEARNAIFGMNGNIPPYRDPGETVLASDLNGLTTALNAIQ